MSRMVRTIQDVRKRWARHRSKSLAPNKEDELYRVGRLPKVLDPRVRARRHK